MVHLPLVLTLISNSPRILISRQTIGIEIDNSIAFCYATTPLFPLPLFPCYPVFYYLCQSCHSGFRSPVIMSFITSAPYVIMASVHSVCHFGFCPLCHYVFCSPVTLSFTYFVHYVFRSFCLV